MIPSLELSQKVICFGTVTRPLGKDPATKLDEFLGKCQGGGGRTLLCNISLLSGSQNYSTKWGPPIGGC